MKVPLPLSLKVSLWLLLNLCLLAAIGVAFFVLRGGLGWDALLAGPTADQAIVRGHAIVAEVAAAAPEDRAAVLERAAASYGVEFVLFRLDDSSTLGAEVVLPPGVQNRIGIARATGRGREFGALRGPRRELGSWARNMAEDAARPRRGLPEEEIRRDAPETPRGPPDPAREREGMRFIVRDGSPPSFWVGTRTGLIQRDRRPSPAMLIARVDSFWGLLRYLDLESWILGAAGVLALSIAFWLPLVRGITRALGELTKATEQIAGGRFDTRVPAKRRDEIGQLGESVNRMAARLDTHVTGQKRFLADVAHELCSPLARLQLASGILAERAPADLRALVGDVRDEVQQMSTLVNELLAFTQAGLQPREVALGEVALAPVVENAVGRENGSGRVTIAVPAELRARANAALLERAIGNLVRNALRYAGEAAVIAVAGKRDGDRVLLVVEDNGPGVASEALDRLGEPFYRPEFARTRELGGVGLGLAIVRNSVAACGGNVRFSNRIPQGFRVELRLLPA